MNVSDTRIVGDGPPCLESRCVPLLDVCHSHVRVTRTIYILRAGWARSFIRRGEQSVMGRAKTARANPAAGRPPSARRRFGTELDRAPSRGNLAGGRETLGLRERKKARLRQEIIDTAVRLFRKRGYEKTRIDDIVQSLEISQPTFFRYFPSGLASGDSSRGSETWRSFPSLSRRASCGVHGRALQHHRPPLGRGSHRPS